MVNFFKECLKKLKEHNCIVTIENSNYVIREVDLDKILGEIPISDPRKEKKLIDFIYGLKG